MKEMQKSEKTVHSVHMYALETSRRVKGGRGTNIVISGVKWVPVKDDEGIMETSASSPLWLSDPPPRSTEQ